MAIDASPAVRQDGIRRIETAKARYFASLRKH